MEHLDYSECVDNIRKALILKNISPKKSERDLLIENVLRKTTLSDSSILEILRYCEVLITPSNAQRFYSDRKIMRNIILYSIMIGEKSLFDVFGHRESCLFIEMDEEEGFPKFKWFRSMPFFMPPRNRFVQIVHNLLCYFNHSDWITKFLRDEASSITGADYLAAGGGSIEELKRLMKRFPTQVKAQRLLEYACMGDCSLKTCAFLISKGAKLTPGLESQIKNPYLLHDLKTLR